MAKRIFDGRTSKLVTEVEEMMGTEIDKECRILLEDVVTDYATAAEKATSSATESVSSSAEAFINATADYAERVGKKGRDAGSVYSDINEIYVNSRDVILDKISSMIKYSEKISKILEFLMSSKNLDITQELLDRGIKEGDLETLLSFDKSLFDLVSQTTLNLGVTAIAQNYLDGAKDLVGTIYSKIDGKLDKEDLIEVADILGLETAYDIKGTKGDYRDKSSLRKAAKERAHEKAVEYAESVGARKIADLSPQQLKKYRAIQNSYMEDSSDDDDFYIGKSKSKSKFSDRDDDDYSFKKRSKKTAGGIFKNRDSSSSSFGVGKSSKLKKSFSSFSDRDDDDNDRGFGKKKSFNDRDDSEDTMIIM